MAILEMEEIMKKKILAGILTGLLAVGVLAGCGGEQGGAAAGNSGVQAEGTETGQKAESEGKGTITVAASATPHSEILEQAKPILAEQGWDLQVKVFDDYNLPNEVVESGEFDANYFQHIPYLENFNETKGTHLVNAGGIHYEHLSGNKKRLIRAGRGRCDRSAERYDKRSARAAFAAGQRNYQDP